MTITIDADKSRDMVLRLLSDKEAMVIVDGERIEVEPPTRDKGLLKLTPLVIRPNDLDYAEQPNRV